MVKWILSLMILLFLSGCDGSQTWDISRWTEQLLEIYQENTVETVTEPQVTEVPEVVTEKQEPQSAFPVNVEMQDIYAEDKTEIIVLGDSRTVGLYCSMTYTAEEFSGHIFYHIAEDHTGFYGDTVFAAKGGEGYPWFETYGAALGVAQMDKNSVFVVWYGVNDLWNVDKYINYVNYTLVPFGVPVYYMTIGPSDQHWAESNPQIIAFNEALRAGLLPEVKVIDMHAFISEGMANGQFGTTDGLHYNYETCRAIYQHMVDVIEADRKQ